jgi:hypothetical protein
MNVDHSSGPGFQQHRGHDAHETGTGDKVQCLRLQIVVERRVKSFACRKFFVINDMRRNVPILREFQPASIRPVGNHTHDLSGVGRITRRLNKGRHVGTAARN